MPHSDLASGGSQSSIKDGGPPDSPRDGDNHNNNYNSNNSNGSTENGSPVLSSSMKDPRRAPLKRGTSDVQSRGVAFSLAGTEGRGVAFSLAGTEGGSMFASYDNKRGSVSSARARSDGSIGGTRRRSMRNRKQTLQVKESERRNASNAFRDYAGQLYEPMQLWKEENGLKTDSTSSGKGNDDNTDDDGSPGKQGRHRAVSASVRRTSNMIPKIDPSDRPSDEVEETLAQSETNPFTLQFKDEMLEYRYVNEYTPTQLLFARAFTYLAISVWLLVTVLEAVRTEGNDRWILLAIRILCIPIGIGALYMTYRVDLFEVYFERVMLASMWTLATGAYVCGAIGDNLEIRLGTVTIAMTCFLMFIGTRFVYTCIPIGLILIQFQFLGGFTMDWDRFLALDALLILAIVIGLAAKYFNELYSRRSFVIAWSILLQRELTHLEQDHTEELLLNVLPEPVAQRLRGKTNAKISDKFSSVSILFCDVYKFAEKAQDHTAPEMVRRLNRVFTVFDNLCLDMGCEKIKTIGSVYMVGSGLPIRSQDHAQVLSRLAIAMMKNIDSISERVGFRIELMMGMHSGPCVAGIIGTAKFSYDLWGDAVNTASRMESHGIPNKIQISESTAELIRKDFDIEERGVIPVKGKGDMRTYFLLGEKGCEPFVITLATGTDDRPGSQQSVQSDANSRASTGTPVSSSSGLLNPDPSTGDAGDEEIESIDIGSAAVVRPTPSSHSGGTSSEHLAVPARSTRHDTTDSFENFTPVSEEVVLKPQSGKSTGSTPTLPARPPLAARFVSPRTSATPKRTSSTSSSTIPFVKVDTDGNPIDADDDGGGSDVADDGGDDLPISGETGKGPVRPPPPLARRAMQPRESSPVASTGGPSPSPSPTGSAPIAASASPPPVVDPPQQPKPTGGSRPAGAGHHRSSSSPNAGIPKLRTAPAKSPLSRDDSDLGRESEEKKKNQGGGGNGVSPISPLLSGPSMSSLLGGGPPTPRARRPRGATILELVRGNPVPVAPKKRSRARSRSLIPGHLRTTPVSGGETQDSPATLLSNPAVSRLQQTRESPALSDVSDSGPVFLRARRGTLAIPSVPGSRDNIFGGTVSELSLVELGDAPSVMASLQPPTAIVRTGSLMTLAKERERSATDLYNDPRENKSEEELPEVEEEEEYRLRFHPWTLRFEYDDVERDFRRYVYNNARLRLLNLMAILLLMTGIFFLTDGLLASDLQQDWYAISMLVVLVGYFSFLSLSSTPFFDKILTSSIVLYTLTLSLYMILLVWGADSIFYLSFRIALLECYFYSFVRIRYFIKISVCLLIGVVTLVVEMFWVEQATEALSDGFGVIIMANVMGTFSAFVTERQNRKEYQLILALRQEQKTVRTLSEMTEKLLYNSIPRRIAKKLRAADVSSIAEQYHEAGILFTDIVSFTTLSSNKSADEVVNLLNMMFVHFDELADKYHIEKIKTIGDAYMCAALPGYAEEHAICEMALDMRDHVIELNKRKVIPENLAIRIGINIGPVVAGVIGHNKYIYDMWGHEVTMANKLEETGAPDEIHVAQIVQDRMADRFEFESRGTTQIEDRKYPTYFLKGRKSIMDTLTVPQMS